VSLEKKRGSRTRGKRDVERKEAKVGNGKRGGVESFGKKRLRIT
jgi:hypothetical protein